MRRLLAAGCCASLSWLAGCEPAVTGADFAAWQHGALSQGLLRTDREAAEIPVTPAMLAENFRRIAFGLEPSLNAGRSELDLLARWEGPVRWSLRAPAAEAAAIRAEVERTLAMLGGVTGLSISPAGNAPDDVNLMVMVLDAGEYEPLAASVEAIRPDLAQAIRRFRTDPGTPCNGQGYVLVDQRGEHPAGSLAFAVVLIRAGLGERLRSACIEEELAQTLGLPNDDARVRPSIFNDDQQFQNLTRHDAMLLRILYDQRLRAGMRADEAMPLVRAIAEELAGPGVPDRRRRVARGPDAASPETH